MNQTSLRAGIRLVGTGGKTHVETQQSTKLTGLMCVLSLEGKSRWVCVCVCKARQDALAAWWVCRFDRRCPTKLFATCLHGVLYFAYIPKTVVYTSSGFTVTLTASLTPCVGPVIQVTACNPNSIPRYVQYSV